MTQRPRARILYCENNVDGTVGGSYYSLLYLLRGLDRTRYSPIAVFYTHHALLTAFREAGVETLVWRKPKSFAFAARMSGRLPWLRPPLLVLQKALNVLPTLVLPALARAWFLRRRAVRIVHLNNTVLLNHDWMLGARLAGVPCVTHERGINESYAGAGRLFGRRLAAVICISEAVRDNMRRRGADFGNLITIPNGLDPETMRVHTPPAEVRSALGLDPDAVVIGMVGNIKAWKGQEILVQAMDRIRRACPAARCVLVGDTSPADLEYEHAVRQLVSSLGLQQHVIFAGFQRNVTDFLLAFDVVVHASVLPEPFGRVILEAMACRKPVIGSRAGAIPEIIEEGVTGLTFPPGDPQALAEAIADVIRNRERARELGENGYHRLVERFHIARNIEATQRVYETLLAAN